MDAHCPAPPTPPPRAQLLRERRASVVDRLRSLRPRRLPKSDMPTTIELPSVLGVVKEDGGDFTIGPFRVKHPSQRISASPTNRWLSVLASCRCKSVLGNHVRIRPTAAVAHVIPSKKVFFCHRISTCCCGKPVSRLCVAKSVRWVRWSDESTRPR